VLEINDSLRGYFVVMVLASNQNVSFTAWLLRGGGPTPRRHDNSEERSDNSEERSDDQRS
jgi:hypothetical protein